MSNKAQEFDLYYLEALTFEPTAMAALVQCYLHGRGTEVDLPRTQNGWIQKLNLWRKSDSIFKQMTSHNCTFYLTLDALLSFS